MKPRNFSLFLLLALIAVGLVPIAFADGPSGAGPGDPLMVTGNGQALGPNASLWFYFDYTGATSSIEVDLDANGIDNVGLAVFTPQQASARQLDPTTKPVGIGSRPGAATAAAIHDLVWVGAFNFPGRFFAVVTNNNLGAITFRLTITGPDVALRPTVAPTPRLSFANPFATSIPISSIEGRLLFHQASGGNIYTVNGDGSNPQRVTMGLDPSLSPDGKRIAFSRWSQPAGLFVIDITASNEQQILKAEQLIPPQWSPDGTRIVFTRQSGCSLDE